MLSKKSIFTSMSPFECRKRPVKKTASTLTLFICFESCRGCHRKLLQMAQHPLRDNSMLGLVSRTSELLFPCVHLNASFIWKKPSSHSQMVSIVLIAAAIFLEFTRVAGRLYSQLELRSKGIISAPGYLDSLGRKQSFKNDGKK